MTIELHKDGELLRTFSNQARYLVEQERHKWLKDVGRLKGYYIEVKDAPETNYIKQYQSLDDMMYKKRLSNKINRKFKEAI